MVYPARELTLMIAPRRRWTIKRATSEDLLDLLVFVGFETEIGEGLIDVGVRRSELDRLLDLLRIVLRGIDLRGIRRTEV